MVRPQQPAATIPLIHSSQNCPVLPPAWALISVFNMFASNQKNCLMLLPAPHCVQSLNSLGTCCSALLQVNVPKTKKAFCKGCKKHMTMKVTQYKTGKASLYAQGAWCWVCVCMQHTLSCRPAIKQRPHARTADGMQQQEHLSTACQHTAAAAEASWLTYAAVPCSSADCC